MLRQDDAARYFYSNEMNLAVKFSNMMNKEVFTTDLKHYINQMHAKFENTERAAVQEQHMNNSYFWLVGVKSMGREVYVVYPPNYTSAKVDQEKRDLMKIHF